VEPARRDQQAGPPAASANSNGFLDTMREVYQRLALVQANFQLSLIVSYN
jgi:hypothetical protein